MAPTILFVPGLWVGPSPSQPVRDILETKGLKTEVCPLISTGTTSPGNPSLTDDVAAIRKHIEGILDCGGDAFLVLHSASGFLGGAACEGLLKKDREGKSSIVGAVYLTAAVVPGGTMHQPLPFMDFQGDSCFCKDPTNLLFGDLPPTQQQEWLSKLQPQPARDWDAVIPYAPLVNLPSTYVVCENDQLLSPQLQENFAVAAGSKIERVKAGHMPTLVVPDQIAEIIEKAVEAETAEGWTRTVKSVLGL